MSIISRNEPKDLFLFLSGILSFPHAFINKGDDNCDAQSGYQIELARFDRVSLAEVLNITGSRSTIDV